MNNSIKSLINDKAIKKVLQCLSLNSKERALMVGGCVRDGISEVSNIFDIDIATNLNPEEILSRITKLNIGTVNDNAIEYGAINLYLDQYEFTITSFRKDIKNFGRSAVVEQVNDIEEDAKRRDFTVNAIYLDINGNIYDFFNGQADIKNRLIRFIGDPEQRIREDYLRIFRFFRFIGLYGNIDSALNKTVIEVLGKTINGIYLVSKERITKELSKTIITPFYKEVFKKIEELKVLREIFTKQQDIQREYSFNQELFISMAELFKARFDNKSLLTILPFIFSLDATTQKNITKGNFINITKIERDLILLSIKYPYILTDTFNNISKNSDQNVDLLIKLIFNRNIDKNKILTLAKFNKDGFENIKHLIENSPSLPINGSDIIQYSPKIRRERISYILQELSVIWCKSNYSLTKEEILNIAIDL